MSKFNSCDILEMMMCDRNCTNVNYSSLKIFCLTLKHKFLHLHTLKLKRFINLSANKNIIYEYFIS